MPRDLHADIKWMNSWASLPIPNNAIDNLNMLANFAEEVTKIAAEAIDRAISAEAEVERLKERVREMQDYLGDYHPGD